MRYEVHLQSGPVQLGFDHNPFHKERVEDIKDLGARYYVAEYPDQGPMRIVARSCLIDDARTICELLSGKEIKNFLSQQQASGDPRWVR